MSDEERKHRRPDRPSPGSAQAGRSNALDSVPEGCIGFHEAFEQYRDLRTADPRPAPDDNSKKWDKWISVRLDQLETTADEFMRAVEDREFRPLVMDPGNGRIMEVPRDLWEDAVPHRAVFEDHIMLGSSSPYSEWNGLAVFIRQERFEAWLANQKMPAPAATGECPSELDEKTHQPPDSVVITEKHQAGRKTDVDSQRTDIIDRFLEMVSDEEVSFKRGGLAKVTKVLHIKFSNYRPDSIRKIVSGLYKEAGDRAKKPETG